jgi:hypothetical protein
MKILPQSTYSPPTQPSFRATNTKPKAVINLEEAGSSSKIADEGHEDMMKTELDNIKQKNGYTISSQHSENLITKIGNGFSSRFCSLSNGLLMIFTPDLP